MKTWLIVAVVGLLVVISLVAVNALQNEENITDESNVVVAPSCGGRCNAGGSCGNPSCGFETTGTCGCRK